ncbi:hypothetical protein ES708_09337 [subsurface metagenome]
MAVAINRGLGSGLPSKAGIAKGRPLPHIPPSKPQEPERQVFELPLNETTSLLFSTFNGTPYVLVVRRKPQSDNPRNHQPSVLSTSFQLGRIARAMRAGYCIVKGNLLALSGGSRYPARRLLLSYHQLNRNLRSLAALRQSIRTSGVVKRPIHILTSLPSAAREALSLVKRIGQSSQSREEHQRCSDDRS